MLIEIKSLLHRSEPRLQIVNINQNSFNRRRLVAQVIVIHRMSIFPRQPEQLVDVISGTMNEWSKIFLYRLYERLLYLIIVALSSSSSFLIEPVNNRMRLSRFKATTTLKRIFAIKKSTIRFLGRIKRFHAVSATLVTITIFIENIMS